MNLRIIIIFLFLLISSFAYTQTTTNPFELFPHTKKEGSVRNNTPNNSFELEVASSGFQKNIPPKDSTHKNPFVLVADTVEQMTIDTSATPDTTQNDDSTQVKRDSLQLIKNPFAVIARDKISPKEETKKTYPISPSSKKSTIEVNEKTSLFPIILFNLLVFTILLTIFRSYVSKIFKAVFNDNMFNQLFNERYNVNFSVAFVPLYLLFILNMGLFLYLTFIKGSSVSLGNLYVDIGYVSIRLIVVIATQHLLLMFIGNIFSIESETKKYNFAIIVFLIFIGLILVFFNLIMTYASLEMSEWVGYLGLLFIAITYILRLIRGLFIANKFLVLHKFHFLLYICTLEIAPVLILYRLVTLQLQ